MNLMKKRPISSLYYDQDQELGDWNNGLPLPSSQDNPPDEIISLGLRLTRSASLLDLVRRTVLGQNDPPVASVPSQICNSGGMEDVNITKVLGATSKPRATSFPASSLTIGSWQYSSRKRCDLVVKCYFAHQKLIWEILQNGLKRKIEIPWSYITSIRANYRDDGPDTLTVLHLHNPVFALETDPQPKKHTVWDTCEDFTGGQASRYREHILEFPSGTLKKHFEKMIQSDMRLNLLSQQFEMVFDSPYFENQTSGLQNGNEANSRLLNECSTTSTSALPEHRPFAGATNCASIGDPSPSSVVDFGPIKGKEMMAPTDEELEFRNILEDFMLSDAIDNSCETSLVKKVHSFCNLLEIPPETSNLHTRENELYMEGVSNASQGGTSEQDFNDILEPQISRKDSFEDFLLQFIG